ncbi:MAG: alanine racemase [Pseudomonadota bacterium]
MAAQTLSDLQTPSLILDRGKLMANIERMAKRAAALKTPLRPHLKTPKSVHVAKMLQEAGAKGFNVSTLREAEFFFNSGFDDLFYCVPFAPAKTSRALALVEAGCSLTLSTDSLEGAKACVAAAEAASGSKPLSFVVEIDVDGYRSGATMEGTEVVDAAKALDASSATHFAGIMSYAGASYGKKVEEVADFTENHMKALRTTKKKLEDAGLNCEMTSFGSTPAVLHAREIDDATEARCGIYAFQDLFQAGIGAAEIDDIALSVLTTVTARQQRYNRFVIDAGALALSKDRSTAGRPFDAEFGLVCDATTGKPIGDLAVTIVSQEIGLVTSLSGASVDLDKFPIGTQLRVLPNHADMTAAAYEEYHVVNGGADIVEVWSRTNHWSEV